VRSPRYTPSSTDCYNYYRASSLRRRNHCFRAPVWPVFPDAFLCQAEYPAFPDAMNKRDIALAILLAGASLGAASASHAQIAAHVDASGRVVFSNEDSQVPKLNSMSAAGATNLANTESSERMSQIAKGAASSSRAPVDERLDRIVREAAERHRVDPALVKAVIDTESGWNPRAISNKGAVGLMQLIPGTAQRFGVGNLLDPAQNVEGGTSYLKTLLDRYNGDLMKSLAAYNAGENAVDRSGGVPAYPETRNYVRKVTDAYFRPGSGRNITLWSPPRPVVRREIDSQGRTVFTNE